MNFFTAVSGAETLDFGCFFNRDWCYGGWKSNYIRILNLSIEYLELYALTVASELWAGRLQNRRVIIFCDNKSVVEMINKAVSSCKNYMVLIRLIALTSIKITFNPLLNMSTQN